MHTTTPPAPAAIDPTDPSTWRNRTGEITADGLGFLVEVVDGRYRFGHFDLLVRPQAGQGERWVEHHKVQILDIAR